MNNSNAKNRNINQSNFEKNHITNKMIECSYYGDYTEYSRNDYATIGGEIALWRAVLLQYLIDLKIKSKKKKYNSVKKEAYKWFMCEENKNDVRKVCEYAGYEYRNVMSLVNDIINNNENFKLL